MPEPIFLTLLRHGRSLADDEGVHEGRYDSPLTERGRQQLSQRAIGWQREGKFFDLIIGSPLQRARTSAEIVASIIPAPLELLDEWMEMDNGPLAKMSFEEAERLYPTPAFRNPYEPFCVSGESGWQLHIRSAQAVEALIRRGAGRYLVVSHGMILNAAMRMIMGISPAVNQSGTFFSFGDAGFATFRYKAHKHQWLLQEFEQGFLS